MAKKILMGAEAKNALIKGINIVANCVKSTLGAKGRFVALDRSYTFPLITNDGVTIAKEISLPDEFENMGAKLVSEISSQTNTDSGDGTTTAIVLAQALVEQGMKLVASGENPVIVKRNMEKVVEDVISIIRAYAIPVRGSDDIEKVATISSRDPEFGEIIANIISELGNDLVITVDDSQTNETKHEIVKGIQFDKGYISPYMVTDPDKMVAEYNNPLILVSDIRINSVPDILPLLESTVKRGRSLVIISDEISNEVAGTLITNKMKGIINVVCVKPPKFGENREAWLEDIAVVTGAKCFTSKLGYTIKDVTIDDLGSADKVKVEKESTTIIGGHGDTKNIEERANSIRCACDSATNEYDRKQFKERLAKMTNGVAVIRVGANTEIELKDKKLRLEDALSATRAAIEFGIVPGGGIALMNAIVPLAAKYSESEDQKYFDAVSFAISEPFNNIVNNAGLSPSGCALRYKVDNVERNNPNMGFDVTSGEMVDMLESGIIDPAKVTIKALENAMSVAGMILTTETLVADEKEPVQIPTAQ